MWGVLPVENVQIGSPIKNEYIKENAQSTKLFRGMLTCHSLTLLNEQLCGDPLDVKVKKLHGNMFRTFFNYRCSNQLAGFWKNHQFLTHQNLIF